MIQNRHLGIVRRVVAAVGATVGAWGLFSYPTTRGSHLLLGLVVLGSAVLPFSRRLEAQVLARALWLQVLVVCVLRALVGPERVLGPSVATALVLGASVAVLGLDRLGADEHSPLLRLSRHRISASFGALLAAMQAVSCGWLFAMQFERFGTLNLALPLGAISLLASVALLRARSVGLALSGLASGTIAVLAGSSFLASPRAVFAVHFALAAAQLLALLPLWRAAGRYLTSPQSSQHATSPNPVRIAADRRVGASRPDDWRELDVDEPSAAKTLDLPRAVD
jgi:hypothetical protein